MNKMIPFRCKYCMMQTKPNTKHYLPFERLPSHCAHSVCFCFRENTRKEILCHGMCVCVCVCWVCLSNGSQQRQTVKGDFVVGQCEKSRRIIINSHLSFNWNYSGGNSKWRKKNAVNNCLFHTAQPAQSIRVDVRSKTVIHFHSIE